MKLNEIYHYFFLKHLKRNTFFDYKIDDKNI